MRLYDDVKKEYDSLNKAEFEPIDKDKKIYDKKFDTKPIGYFKDAMIRFSKNRTNVVATIILLILVMLAIFVPILTTKNYTQQQTQLAHLPPRVPILSRFGIMDGSANVVAQTINPDNYNEEFDVFYPDNYFPEFIIWETVENYFDNCSRIAEICVGGEVVLRTQRSTDTQMSITARSTFMVSTTDGISVNVDVSDIIGSNTKLDVILVSGNEDYVIGTIDRPGMHSFNPFDNPDLPDTAWSTYRIKLVMHAEATANRVVLNSVSVTDASLDEPVVLNEGFSLANFQVSSSGLINRQNAQIMRANFKYMAYESALREARDTLSNDDYYELMEQYADECKWDPETGLGGDPDPNATSRHARIFPPECPIIRTTGRSSMLPDPRNPGEFVYDYFVVIDYQRALGFETTPYFFFGTTNAGHDLFALTWVALRTSLLIGLVVAVINITVGIIYGSISGYYGGKVDLLMERFSEIISRIPWLVLLSIFYALIGPGALTLILILIVSGWIGVASVTRTQFYRYKGREYVLASRTLGAKDSRLIFRHILPNGIGTIITASVLMIPGVIFTEAALSYLGFGIGHGQSFRLFGLIELSGVSIGVLLADGRNEMIDKPYLTLFPAIIISILMITFNMFGNALRDAFNPSLRGSE